MFSQNATGISIHGNDLVVTTIHKKLITYSHKNGQVQRFYAQGRATTQRPLLRLKRKLTEKSPFPGPEEIPSSEK